MWYNEVLFGVKGVILPKVKEGASHVYHLYVIRVERRDKLQDYLKEQGIGTLIHYPIPPHLQECYKDLGYKQGDFPIAEEIAKTALSLPIWIGMTESDVKTVANAVKEFVG